MHASLNNNGRITINRRDSQLIYYREAAVPSASAQTKTQHAETPTAPPLLCCSDSDGEVAFSILFHLKINTDPDSGSPI